MKFKPCPGCKTPAKCAKEGCQKEQKTGMAAGGMTKKKPDMMGAGMYGGGMTKKRKGYNKGGYCGASNPAERPMKTSK
jgi:hypothetical protein